MTNSTVISPNRLAELRAKFKKSLQQEIQNESAAPIINLIQPNIEQNQERIITETSSTISSPIQAIESSDNSNLETNQGYGRTGEVITYNTEQQEAITVGKSGSDLVIIGAAGTGKTTVTQGIIRELIQSHAAGILNSDGHKYLKSGTPGIVCISFTRRAVANMKRFMPEDMRDNVITFHKLLEYGPVFYEVPDPNSGEMRKTMRFEPARNSINPLPASIKILFVEEASMFSTEYDRLLKDAIRHKIQIIYLGDIQQLPPVFGPAVLGYRMLDTKIVELTQVYRQALESPIIRLAHRILSGKPIPEKEFPDWHFPGKLKLHPWKKKLHADLALATAAKFFTTAVDKGEYLPEEDMILIPFNKSFGTDELNKHIAQHIARKGQKIVYEIIAGFNKHYLSVGDKVLFDKEDAEVISITKNGSYFGKMPQAASVNLDYWGHNLVDRKQEEMDDDNVDFYLAQVSASADEERVKTASHIVRVRMLDSLEEIDLDQASEINALIMGYALTVHKSQGSEFRKVFLILHQSHATMIQRELLYTGVTRAKEELYVICEPESFIKGIESQRIKGNTLAEKAEYFKGKLENEG